MPILKTTIRFLSVILLVFIITACSTQYDGGDFTFISPGGYKITIYTASAEATMNAETLLFAQNKHVYFQIYRQKISEGGSLALLLDGYISENTERDSHYQFISQKAIKIADHDAIEYVFREFHGEPYIQNWEIWIEKDGVAYTLVCSEPVVSTIGETIPIAQDCLDLVDGFRFSEQQ